MAIYLKKFETQAAYEAAQSGLILPNVSLTVDNNTVHYNPYVESIETRVVAKFDVYDTSNPTQIICEYADSPFSAIEIDGVEQPSVVSAYTFSTTGEHTVKYTLTDPTIIGESAFGYCTNLTSINIPSSVTSISQNAFDNCSGLINVTIPNSVTSIGNDAFNYCESLTSIDIPSGITSIGSGTFQYCWNLTSVTIPNSVTSIGAAAFQNCSSLTSIDIPSGVTSIGIYAFGYCNGLTSIIVNAITPPTIVYDTFVDVDDCPIYVPSGSVEAYKVAEYWSDYEERIQAIP